jgi:molybdate/tungstate transport system substrate-binding protein
MKSKLIISIIILIAIIGFGVYGYTAYNSYSENGTLIVYAASSLAPSMNETAAKFKSQHPNVNVEIHYGGSADLISQITQLNKSADIMASADYGLIDQRMMPNYATFNLKYARNEMVIAYTDKSKNSSQINSDNWYQILSQNDVKFGFADPNSAPAGYRGVMMIQLAESYYNNSTIFSTLIGQNTAITAQINGTGYIINSPTSIDPSSKVVIRPAVGELMPVLQSGAVDYVLVYKSDAEQLKGSGVKYISLPDKLRLSNTTYEPDYKKIKLVQYSGTNKSKNVTLTPIVYGITQLKNAPNSKLATEFLELLLSSEGVQITRNNFQDPITPAEPTNGSTDIPSALQNYLIKI